MTTHTDETMPSGKPTSDLAENQLTEDYAEDPTFISNRAEAIKLRNTQNKTNQSTQVKQVTQFQAMAENYSVGEPDTDIHVQGFTSED